ncbi:MAG TPA: tetratricopeptide repeat protein [Dongiaceae bacterium]|nr:tetratricopeptide repeat protein [Dongiaceae bacterium]
MPLIGLLVLGLQICVVVHAFRTGRPYWWIFVIMAFPLIGTLIYYLVEIMPGSRQEQRLYKIGGDIAKAINPDKEMHRRAAELTICGSTHNKLQLARECVERGQFDDAIALYESAREGQYVDAPDLLLGLGRSHFFNGDHTASRDLLLRLRRLHPSYYEQETTVLAARAAFAMGEADTALRELETILDRSVGLEARYRYAEMLWQQGVAERAKAELNRIIEHAQRFKLAPGERSWAKLAKQTLAALG